MGLGEAVPAPPKPAGQGPTQRRGGSFSVPHDVENINGLFPTVIATTLFTK